MPLSVSLWDPFLFSPFLPLFYIFLSLIRSLFQIFGFLSLFVYSSAYFSLSRSLPICLCLSYSSKKLLLLTPSSSTRFILSDQIAIDDKKGKVVSLLTVDQIFFKNYICKLRLHEGIQCSRIESRNSVK